MPDAVSAPTPRPLLPGHPLLGRAFYLHGLFPEEFLDELLAWRSRVACDRASGNMLARRYHFTSEEVATTLLDGLRRSGVADVCGYSRVIPVVRVIDYPSGGYIAPHTDGVDYHPTTGEVG